ncbi:MAG: 3'-5' exonuclease [Candidatus Yanofskybacteria bacterium]|nr:3'-5' exonuclease [Candidatus Yanofskybacteria bacterium]
MIVVDVETTGTDPLLHAIVSIGAVDFCQPGRQFYRECRIFDGAQVQAQALAVNGFTVEQVTDSAKPTLEEAIGQFIAWCREAENRTLGGHNTAFDRGFLQASADRYNLAWHFGNRVLDLHSVGWTHMMTAGIEIPKKAGRSDLSCDAILQYTGLPAEPKPHNGLVGAKMEAEAFSRLVRGRPLFEEFATYPIPFHPHASGAEPAQGGLF